MVGILNTYVSNKHRGHLGDGEVRPHIVVLHPGVRKAWMPDPDSGESATGGPVPFRPVARRVDDVQDD